MVVLQQALPVEGPCRALDVGTRLGEFAFRLAESLPEGSEVVGIDNDPAVAEKARAKFGEKGVRFELMDAKAMDLPDASFDVVAISNTLHHIEGYEQVFSEMLRVLRPGGWLVLNEMYHDGQTAAQRVHHDQHTLEAKLDCLTGGYQRETWTRAELVEIFQKLPLRDVSFTDFQEEAVYDEKLAVKNEKLADAVEKIRGKPEYASLKAEALAIQERCRRDGIRRCTQLLCVGRKR